jgi:two-component system chemotaxis response regulator CheB
MAEPFGNQRDRRDPVPLRSATRPIRIMLVDDSLTIRTIFARIIGAEAGMELVAQANSAEAAFPQLALARPDVVLLDLEMPGMGGLQALPRILAEARGVQVLVVSSLTETGAWHSLEAMTAGAADTMAKPQPGDFDLTYRRELIARIRALGCRIDRSGDNEARFPAVRERIRPRSFKPARLVAIGASTGGVHAINSVMRGLPDTFTLPILITQHIPASFVPVFARQLQLSSGRITVVAEEGTPIRAGTIVLAPGHAHMLVRGKGADLVATLSAEPASSGCCPAVDPMLASIAQVCDGAAVGVILSGMGRDGLSGATALYEAGGAVIAQDAESCAVWGMPKAVTTAGIIAATMPPDKMPSWLLTHTGANQWT